MLAIRFQMELLKKQQAHGKTWYQSIDKSISMNENLKTNNNFISVSILKKYLYYNADYSSLKIGAV